MRRSRLAGALLGSAMLVAVTATVAVNAAGGVPPDPGVSSQCLGLSCPADDFQVPEARNGAPSLSKPSQLDQQTEAGFYEYGLSSPWDKPAVAYVVPPGQLERMPASVRALPIVKSLENETAVFQNRSTVVILDRSMFRTVPKTEVTTQAARSRREKRTRRPVARAADVDPWGCPSYYFCIYDQQGFQGTAHGLYGNGTGWFGLSAINFNDRAESMRNRRNNDSLLAEHWSGTNGYGTRYCADSHSSDREFTNNAIGNNEASAWANTPDNIHC